MGDEYNPTFWWNASFRPYVEVEFDNSGLGGPMTGVEGGYFLKWQEKQVLGHIEATGVEILALAQIDPAKTEHWALGPFARFKKFYSSHSLAAGTGLTIRNIDPNKTDPSYGFLLDAEFGILADAFFLSSGVSIYPAADSRKYVGALKAGFDLFKLMGTFDVLMHAGSK